MSTHVMMCVCVCVNGSRGGRAKICLPSRSSLKSEGRHKFYPIDPVLFFFGEMLGMSEQM